MNTRAIGQLTSFNNYVSNAISDGNIYNANSAGEAIEIGEISINMNISEIANDYDASRVGEKVMEEIVHIARKAGYNSLSRR
jgi:hypothetical protein